MSQSDAGKGDAPRPVDRDKWDSAPIWNAWQTKAKNQRIWNENQDKLENSNVTIIKTPSA